MNDIPDPEIQFKKLIAKAEQMCARKEQCTQDVKKKIKSWGVDDEMGQRVINTLKDNNFIDEKRFSRAYAKDKFTFNKWGKVKIKNMLVQKGIAAKDIENALGEIGYHEYNQVLTNLLRSKWHSVKGNVYEKKAKTFRFMQSRGYEYGLIMDAIEKLEQHED